jgi:allophanate hydrolase subunit 2
LRLQDAAVLEATLLGAELEFTSDATVAVTGAELPPLIDACQASGVSRRKAITTKQGMVSRQSRSRRSFGSAPG